jgi:cobalt/nickel transport protein
MGRQDGWEKEIGQPVEIVPLTRPYGFWTGNVFRGVVKKDGKPVPNCWVEVERYNQGKEWKLPNDLFMTQYVLTDENGVFSYGVPKSGWWGFVAWPGPSGKTLKSPDGTADAKIAEGCAFWIYATDDKD